MNAYRIGKLLFSLGVTVTITSATATAAVHIVKHGDWETGMPWLLVALWVVAWALMAHRAHRLERRALQAEQDRDEMQRRGIDAYWRGVTDVRAGRRLAARMIAEED